MALFDRVKEKLRATKNAVTQTAKKAGFNEYFLESLKETPARIPQIPQGPTNKIAQAGRAVGNLGIGFVNNVVGRGIVDPTIDLAQNITRTVQGKDTISYDQARSPITRLGYNLAGQNRTPQQVIGNIAGVASPIVDAYSPKGLQALKAPTLLAKINQGARFGGRAGALMGGIQGLEEGRNATLPQQLRSGAIGAATGYGAGIALGTAAPLAEAGIRSGINLVRNPQALHGMISRVPEQLTDPTLLPEGRPATANLRLPFSKKRFMSESEINRALSAGDSLVRRKDGTYDVVTAQQKEELARLQKAGNDVFADTLEQHGYGSFRPEADGSMTFIPNNRVANLETRLPQLPDERQFVRTQKGAKGQLLKQKIPLNTRNSGVAERQTIADQIQNKLNTLEERMYGSATSQFTAKGTRGAGKVARMTRGLQDKTSGLVAQGLGSQNPIVRNIARGVRSLFGSSGNTVEQTKRLGQFQGGMDEAQQLTNDFYRYGTELVSKSKDSLERIHAVLDPELAVKRIRETDLTPDEKQALTVLREVSDLINDMNYAEGKISRELWSKNRGGKYIARAYEEFDLPPEVSQAFRSRKGQEDLSGFFKRKEVDEWKLDNAIRDPFYLMGKRLQQTMANRSIGEYGRWISQQPEMVSNASREGFSQVADHPSWGALAGKYVRKDVLEGIKGFYSDHETVQKLFDVLNAYDRLGPRQFLKKTKTIYNPATRLGNQVGNRVFAFLNGVNLLAFEKNIQTYAKKALKENDPLVRTLRKNGLLGSDFARKDLVNQMADLGVEPKGLAVIDDYLSKTYSAADDQAKIAAAKYWLDKGMSLEETVRRIDNGFQNYSKVGLLYDLGAKTPVFGNAFVRFQGELARIAKNAILEDPIRAASFVGALWFTGEMASMLSGETPEDKQTRESRVGFPHIPFTNIPLAFQTPWGEINAARLFGIAAHTPVGGDSIGSNISRFAPFQIPTNKEELIKGLGTDILAGGVVSTLTNTDFRGKSIRDPEENKYQETTLTPTEQNLNRANFLRRNYSLPFTNDLEDFYKASTGQKDFYGRTKTPAQAASRLVGVKVEQFGPDQAAEQREKNEKYAQYERDDIQQQMSSIEKQALTGKISEKTAQQRLNNLEKKLAKTEQSPVDNLIQVANASNDKYQDKVRKQRDGKFAIIDSNGDKQTYDTRDKAVLELEKADFKKSDENFRTIGDSVLRKNKEGDVAVMSKADYDYKLNANKMQKAKADGDYAGWQALAEKQLEIIQSQLEDPGLDELDQSDLIEKADKLLADIEKFDEYGGFKKPKKPKKVSMPSLPAFKLPNSTSPVTGKGKLTRLTLPKAKLPTLSTVAPQGTPKMRFARPNTAEIRKFANVGRRSS